MLAPWVIVPFIQPITRVGPAFRAVAASVLAVAAMGAVNATATLASVCARWVVPAEHTAATSLVHASRLGDWVCVGIGMVGGAAAGVGSVRATVHGFH